MSRLPSTLAPWEESLAALEPAVATDLGPLLHVLDDLIGRLEQRAGETGEIDGYDGIAHRGTPDRLLASEWLLADELPLEFLRRAAENELTYLRRAYRAPAPRGTVVAVCDAGPEQWGVGRLVQLAALVVLDRRAREAGSELVLVVPQDGSRHSGTLDRVLPHWLRARSPAPATLSQVEAALTCDVDHDDRVWLLSGPTARGWAPGHRRALSSWATAWSADRATRVGIRVGDATTEVDVPEPRNAVAVLRGEGQWRRGRAATGTVGATGRGAVFGSADSRLLWRGEHDNELHSCFVGHGNAPAIRRHQLPATVLAAASMGKRLVVAVTDRERVWIRTIGKGLAHTHLIDVPAAKLGLDGAAIDRITAWQLRPLYLEGPRILLPVGDRWWSLEEGHAEPREVLAAAPGAALDVPRVAERRLGRVTVLHRVVHPGEASAGVVLGPVAAGQSWSATSEDTRVWQVQCNGEARTEIGIAEGERVIGLVSIDSAPALVVLSSGGRLLRTVSSSRTKTWTRWSGPAHFAVHPLRPWIVRTTPGGITVGDLTGGATMLDLRVER